MLTHIYFPTKINIHQIYSHHPLSFPQNPSNPTPPLTNQNYLNSNNSLKPITPTLPPPTISPISTKYNKITTSHSQHGKIIYHLNQKTNQNSKHIKVILQILHQPITKIKLPKKIILVSSKHNH
jgi:hypothetical protein